MTERPSAPAIPSHITKIIRDSDVDLLITKAQELAAKLSGDLTKSQIRNVYASVKLVVNSGKPESPANRRRIKMLLPRLQYAAAKESKLVGLTNELKGCIHALEATDATTYRKHFNNFADYLEAIVAYHYQA